jgi:lipopolysaccharide transport system ATP-binding protein
MLSVSVENVSKVYRLGQINRQQFFGDIRRWVKGKTRVAHGFGDPELEAEQEPEAPDLFYALRNVSFEIEEGDTVGIIGANGAGKSTLLKLLSRITLPSTGRIRIKGRVGSLLEVGTGFQPDMTGRENIYMKAAIMGMTRKEVAAKFDDIVAFSGTEKFLDTPVKRYSSGMGLRLAFSVAAFLEPEILIVDEVLTVGDQQFKDRCMARIREVIKGGCTILFVSHVGEQVRQICRKGLYLKAGRMVCFGDVNPVLDQYEAAVKVEGEVVGASLQGGGKQS